ncbi:MAG: flagellar basal body L-ring protein FlgH [Campylobacterales bacterium]|nr:flagellar basal body L-ring protein FlgH [Campylobacterales bacterium]
MKLIFCSSAALGILVLGGCGAKLTEPEMDFKPPRYVEEMPAKVDEREFASTGSIFGQGENPLFADHKAMHANDIVTVVISETARSSNTMSKDLSENDTIGLGGGTFAAPSNPAVSSYANTLNGLSNIGFNAQSTSAYKGSGAASKNASLSTTVSARIVKVLENGNYFISGRREIMVDEEKQILQISGVIRPYDIDQNNQINSAQMSDAKIMYASEGDMERATRQGWGSKLVQAVWPF